MIVNRIPVSATVTSGAWSSNTPNLRDCKLRQIVVSTATADNSWDFILTDKDSYKIVNLTNMTGTRAISVDIPLTGIYTRELANVATDETVKVMLVIEELS